MPKKRKICFITGTRADYGILKPILEKAKRSKKLDLFIIVTGMHLLPKYGKTCREIEKDGFKIQKIDINSRSRSGQMAKTSGIATIKFTKALLKIKPDIVVVLGDRAEALSAAIAANYLSIPVTHIHGGELSGHVDGVIRHAITKLSSIHFAATRKATERIIKMGEEPWRVINSGAPGLDSILGEKTPSLENLSEKYNIDKNIPLIILVQHPVLGEDNPARQINITLEALLNYEAQIIIIYPNSDAGSKEIIAEIEKKRNQKNIQIYKNIPHSDYLGLMKIATALMGNSSSGIIEAASFRLPVINIGTRQNNRECGENVIHTGYDKKEIANALKKILSRDKLFMKKISTLRNPYGEGHASEKIIDVLEKIDLNKIRDKKMTY
jgi:GDP/UDP-N,N'-diacetylbacillosamine 2-epimerase (hydrolysing)